MSDDLASAGVPGNSAPGGFGDTRALLAEMRRVNDEGTKYNKDAEGEIRASLDRSQQAYENRELAMTAKGAQISQKIDEASGLPIPESKEMPTPPTPGIDPAQMKETLSLVTALAAFGGALTREPLTAALNNFSAGVHGLVQGNQQVYQNELKSFEANVQKAKAENDSIWKKYQAARDKYGTDIAGLQSEMSLIAAETQNPIDMELARRGDLVSLIKIHESNKNSYSKLLEQTLHAMQRDQLLAATAEQRKIANQLARERIGESRRSHDDTQAGKGWQVFQRPDGTLVRVNALTGETSAIEDSKGLVKPKAGGSASGASNTRNSLVQAAGKNALARLGEIKGDGEHFPTTSVMFGQHGTGVGSRAVHAVGQAALSDEQQGVDARYASLVDEAIPVFTGGLRGSDAFRKFLLGQLPGPGDSQETANEKMRLFEQNIKGTVNTFGAAYSSNKAFQADGADDGAGALSAEEQDELNRLRAKHGGRAR